MGRELVAVPRVAPELQWADDLDAGGWRGRLPLWPFDRPQPPELGAFVGSRRFTVEIAYSQAHPVVPASVRPLDPEPNPLARTMHSWHLNGDGTLCLLRTADDWDPQATAADLAVKAAGWFLEHLLMEASVLTVMSDQKAGI